MAAKSHPNPKLQAAQALLALLADKDWHAITLSEVAAKAGLSLSELRALTSSKEGLLMALGAEIDRQVLADMGKDDTQLSPRDRLFDVLMKRIEALAPYKPALQRLADEGVKAPSAVLSVACSIDRAMPWMLEAAGIPSSGLAGCVKAKALAAVYLSALKVWLKDGSADLGPTMGALDKGLDRCGRLHSLLPKPLQDCLA